MTRPSAVAPDQFATFGELLRYLRRRAGLTQRELSIAVGYSDAHLSRLEKGERAPDRDALRARFVPALGLEREPEWVARLLALAADAGHAEAKGQPSEPALQDRDVYLGRLRRSRLVGRAEVQQRLAERLERLSQGVGSVVMLSGEPGIGKTRLLDETMALARARGFQVLVGRCHERDVAIPYLPLADAREAYARRCPLATWERLLEAAGADIHVLLTDTPVKYVSWGRAHLEREMSSMLMTQAEAGPARALRRLLLEMARSAPVLLVVDDLHWADQVTLDLVQGVALHARDLPVCLLGAYREMELERAHPLSRMLVELHRQRLMARERLGRLLAPEAQALMGELLGGPGPPGLAELIYDQTEGNPFFIEELVSGLVESERLIWNERLRQYELAPGEAVEALTGLIPQGIRAAIGLRLDRLDPTTQQALGLASVVGRRFALDVLKRLALGHGLDEAEVEAAISRAQSARFIVALEARLARRDEIFGFAAGAPDLDADYAFAHPLLHQTVYAELDRRRWRRLHAEVGDLLEELYKGGVFLYAERLAFHYLESDDEAKALQYCLRAGDKMVRTYYDADLALGYYLAALQLAVRRGAKPAHRRAALPVPLRYGAIHRFTPEERQAIVAQLSGVLQAVRETPAAPVVAQVASRICIAAMHTGEVYEASIRLHEQHRLGPDVQKLLVETRRGRLVGILEFPGPGGPHPVVLLLHGSPATKEMLADETARYLARGLATLRVDLPGFGETTVPMTLTPADAEILMEAVTAVLQHDRVNPRGVGAVGWSSGPWYGAQLCARDPRVRALVSLSGSLKMHDEPWYINDMFWGPAGHAYQEARWKAGAVPSREPLTWSQDSSVYDVAHQIRCPVLLVYSAVELPRVREQAEELARLVPTAAIRAWPAGVHALVNSPEALEDAAEWMKQQLVAEQPGAVQ